MKFLFVVAVSSLAVFASAAPSGGHGGAIVEGPSGIVTDHGPIGPAGSHDDGWGWGGHGAVIAAAPVAVAAPIAVAPVAVAHSLGVVTKGGGTIGVSGHGAAIRGPGTAPVVVKGPSGKIAADGLWGPTANVGLTGHGHGGWVGVGAVGGWGHGGWGNGGWGNGGWGHGGWGHGW